MASGHTALTASVVYFGLSRKPAPQRDSEYCNAPESAPAPALLSPTGAQVFAPFAFVSNLAGALLALELARFEAGVRFEDGTNYLFASPWAPPHSRMRLHRPHELDCEFCGRPETRKAWAFVWPECDWAGGEAVA